MHAEIHPNSQTLLEERSNKRKCTIISIVAGILMLVAAVVLMIVFLGNKKSNDVLTARDLPDGVPHIVETLTGAKFALQRSATPNVADMSLLGVGVPTSNDEGPCEMAVGLYVNEMKAMSVLSKFNSEHISEIQHNQDLFDAFLNDKTHLPFQMQFRFPKGCSSQATAETILGSDAAKAELTGLTTAYNLIRTNTDTAGGLRDNESIVLDATQDRRFMCTAADTSSSSFVDGTTPQSPVFRNSAPPTFNAVPAPVVVDTTVEVSKLARHVLSLYVNTTPMYPTVKRGLVSRFHEVVGPMTPTTVVPSPTITPSSTEIPTEIPTEPPLSPEEKSLMLDQDIEKNKYFDGEYADHNTLKRSPGSPTLMWPKSVKTSFTNDKKRMAMLGAGPAVRAALDPDTHPIYTAGFYMAVRDLVDCLGEAETLHRYSDASLTPVYVARNVVTCITEDLAHFAAHLRVARDFVTSKQVVDRFVSDLKHVITLTHLDKGAVQLTDGEESDLKELRRILGEVIVVETLHAAPNDDGRLSLAFLGDGAVELKWQIEAMRGAWSTPHTFTPVTQSVGRGLVDMFVDPVKSVFPAAWVSMKSTFVEPTAQMKVLEKYFDVDSSSTDRYA